MGVFSYLLSAAAGLATLASGCMINPAADFVPLFNGKNFSGWEGDTVKTWRIEEGALTGGSLTETVPHNEFIATRKTYANFILKARFKLTGTDGFINTGVQFHSRRLTDPVYEMTGYQADLGDKYWASLYDESRRNKTLISPDSALISRILKKNDWNDYEIQSENGRIRIRLNGTQTVDYKEPDKNIPQKGLIALQIHGGGKAQVAFKDIMIKEL
ncbi:3-keto-disaccharide hydrolase [Dyadobacter sandarakinus]|uniref:DUF1080 domain-containing protein n=1 Tax=Dyadobacter sandarakinus TaxID=2747268 RepID=A0ABX7I2A9_9BACT|nr:DUF1080 domain-containing protein [Dyadobacter sandarakinus]QRQ99676.1 DUF1080 domain-containing protein [Dyadobacter sandarakinus]